jgi:hypothetical protein
MAARILLAMNDVASTFDTVRACALALLSGTVLQADAVSAGRGSVVDWRTVRSGETLQTDGDAFDTAQLFVALVAEFHEERTVTHRDVFAPGALRLSPPSRVDAAASALDVDDLAAEPFVAPAPRICEFMRLENGARRRAFDVGEFRVVVEPHADDEGQASFTRRLADLAIGLVSS